MWKKEKLEKKENEKYIKVKIIGFGEVSWRMKCKEKENKLKKELLESVEEEIEELKRSKINNVEKIKEYSNKFMELEKSVIKVIVKKEV
jgi:hypothetical protein